MQATEEAAIASSTYRIAVIPGDGIGWEVVPPAQALLASAGERFGFSFEWTEFPWGCEYYHETGRMMDEDGIEQLSRFDQIFLGAVGFPGVPDHVSLWGLLIPIRRAFDQYVNLRPVRLLRGIDSPLRRVPESGIEFIVVRENSEGEYSEIGGRLFRGTEREMAVQESVFTRHGVTRVVAYAAELAQNRRGKLTSATKSNGIIHTMPFWDELVREVVGSRFPSVQIDQCHIDALAAAFVLDPQRFDVVVASNLFGDILTDLGAAIIGSIGIAPSANLNPERRFPSMFEPVHGSAPDIAGQGKANPMGQVWAGAMMLDHLGHADAASLLVDTIEHVLAQTDVRTPDLGGTSTTEQVGQELLRSFDTLAGLERAPA